MRLSPPPSGHLTYCTNIHPGETWPEVRRILAEDVPAVRDRLGVSGAFGVGLRLGAAAAVALADPEALADLARVLAANDLYVFTINGFPFGAFHGTRVKEAVYRPDWQEAERLDYTNRLADLLAALLPENAGAGSISTVPGAFGPRGALPGARAAITENLVRHVAHLIGLERRTGRTVVLALEPEPCCLIGTVAETVALFQDHLYARAAVDALARLAGLTLPQAEAALRRHLGVCFDACHAAVEFEDPEAAVARLEAAGVPIAKLQISCGLALDPVAPDAVDTLARFEDGVYLHQVVVRSGDGLARFSDLGDALARFARQGASAGGEAWRVHLHVPVFIERIEPFASTQPFLRRILARHRRKPVAPHLEVETYTWSVLPDRWQGGGMVQAIARELAWVRDELAR